ncbi:unnamed protein product, partial [Discosporangium mesarthrocarpum]
MAGRGGAPGGGYSTMHVDSPSAQGYAPPPSMGMMAPGRLTSPPAMPGRGGAPSGIGYSAGTHGRGTAAMHVDSSSPQGDGGGGVDGALKQLSVANEKAWGTLGAISRSMDKDIPATECWERALEHNPYSPVALAGLGGVHKARGDYRKAVEFLQQAVTYDEKDGHAWEELAYCYLMINDLQNSYTAYQNALYYIQNPKDARLWYGIGLLYDCYGSYSHAIEAFETCLNMDPNFELDHEVRFRVGIINKQQGKLGDALEILHGVLQAVNDPAWCGDVWSQIGHVYELKREIKNAKSAYVKALEYNENHAKALQQLGWLHYKDEDDFRAAINYLKRATDIDPEEGLGWYLLGRCYMAAQKHELAYKAYEKAVNCDPSNPNVWCSLGVLYYQLHQNRDALDAYTRAIKLDPNLCELWYNVGTLYDSCNQTTDALDAYKKAAE